MGMESEMKKEAAKSWFKSKFSCVMYEKEDEEKDAAKMKAETFGRYTGLASAGLMLACGALAVMGGSGGCMFAGAMAFLFFGLVLTLELYHFCEKGCKCPCCSCGVPEEEAPPEGENKDGASPGDVNLEDASDESDSDEEDEKEEKKGPGCCKRNCFKCIRCCPCKHLYEGWYKRAILYFILAIFMFVCGTTIVAGIALLICALLYAFARCRGEEPPVLEDLPDASEAGKEKEAEAKEEPEEDIEAPAEPAKKKGSRKKKK